MMMTMTIIGADELARFLRRRLALSLGMNDDSLKADARSGLMLQIVIAGKLRSLAWRMAIPTATG